MLFGRRLVVKNRLSRNRNNEKSTEEVVLIFELKKMKQK